MTTPQILTMSLDPGLAALLRECLPSAKVVAVAGSAAAEAELARSSFAVVVINDVMEEAGSERLIEFVGAVGALHRPKIIYCASASRGQAALENLLARGAIAQLLVAPVDRDELLRHVSRLAGVAVKQADPVVPNAGNALAAVWEKFREATMRRVDVLDAAILLLLENQLDDDHRASAEREAHKLAGSAGTFGFPETSRLARGVEIRFACRELSPPDAVALSENVIAIRRDLDGTPAQSAQQATREDVSQLVLIVGPDRDLTERVTMEAEGRGLRTVSAETIDLALTAIDRELPSIALINLGNGDDRDAGCGLVFRLGRMAVPIPAVVLASGGALESRVDVARAGGRRFLEQPASPTVIVDTIVEVLSSGRGSTASILAVDDDSQILAALRALLEPAGMNVTTLDDPARFWSVLEESNPDLVILDVDMPRITGLELCRVIRNDRRWSHLPVVFLTSRTDVNTVRRAFEAGADDHVGKPLVSAELLMRVRNRLERVRLDREMAEVDFLTGVASRRKFTDLFHRLLGLARRKNDPITVAVLDVDRFKLINDTHGHGAGDDVLRGVGSLLSKWLRAEDVVGRWGGEEFVLAMYGTGKIDAARRLTSMLQSLAVSRFRTDGGEITVTASIGVAEFPADGADLTALHGVADTAMYRAKTEGRNRVAIAGGEEVGVAPVDVVIVDDDVALVGLLKHNLESRGLSVMAFGDGESAATELGGPRPTVVARVILLDVDLPTLNGIDVLGRLARHGATIRSKVIMLTGRSGDADVLAALKLGARDHVAKPFSIAVLLQKVETLLAGESG